MMMTTHALVGAALGRVARNRSAALLLGIASHALGDLLPHRECPAAIDVPIGMGVLALIAAKFGWDSPEMLGAVGGIAPDGEHLATEIGLQEPSAEIFPTHGPYPQSWLHSMGISPPNDSVQIGLTVAALLVLSADQPGEGQGLRSCTDRPNVAP